MLFRNTLGIGCVSYTKHSRIRDWIVRDRRDYTKPDLRPATRRRRFIVVIIRYSSVFKTTRNWFLFFDLQMFTQLYAFSLVATVGFVFFIYFCIGPADRYDLFLNDCDCFIIIIILSLLLLFSENDYFAYSRCVYTLIQGWYKQRFKPKTKTVMKFETWFLVKWYFIYSENWNNKFIQWIV